MGERFLHFQLNGNTTTSCTTVESPSIFSNRYWLCPDSSVFRSARRRLCLYRLGKDASISIAIVPDRVNGLGSRVVAMNRAKAMLAPGVSRAADGLLAKEL